MAEAIEQQGTRDVEVERLRALVARLWRRNASIRSRFAAAQRALDELAADAEEEARLAARSATVARLAALANPHA